MTLAQLQGQLARLIGLQNVSNDPNVAAWVTDALNQAQLEIAVDLQIPRTRFTLGPGVNPFVLPPGIQSWGVLAVRDITNDNPLAIIDPSRRLAESNPTATGVPIFAEYGFNQLNLYPAPTTPVQIEVVAAVIPADMVLATDQPWNGQYPDYHGLIAMKAALLIHESDWSDPKRTQWVMGRYAARLNQFVKRINAKKDAKPRSEVEISDAPRT